MNRLVQRIAVGFCLVVLAEGLLQAQVGLDRILHGADSGHNRGSHL